MGEVSRREGRTVLFVSHNMGAVRALTRRALLLDRGRISAAGETGQVIARYVDLACAAAIFSAGSAANLDFYRRSTTEFPSAQIAAITVGGTKVEPGATPVLELGSMLTIELQFDVFRRLDAAEISVMVKTTAGEGIALISSLDVPELRIAVEPGRRKVSIAIDDLPLAPGEYAVDVGIAPTPQGASCDLIYDFPLFSVVNRGQVTQWLHRPWGLLHCTSTRWRVAAAADEDMKAAPSPIRLVGGRNG
jgi:lipopolysaccharide transport system ATP-binding protein